MNESRRLVVSLIHRELGKVMCDSMDNMMILGVLLFSCVRSRDINARKMKGRGTLVWLVCKRIEVVIRASCGKNLRVLVPKVVRSMV